MTQLRNFDLSVDEIKLIKSINQIKDNIEAIKINDPHSPRSGFLMKELRALEHQLENLRENTLIR
jgi:hypothetical protein